MPPIGFEPPRPVTLHVSYTVKLSSPAVDENEHAFDKLFCFDLLSNWQMRAEVRLWQLVLAVYSVEVGVVTMARPWRGR